MVMDVTGYGTPGPAIVANGLHKHFGEVHALRGLDLAVGAGTVCGLLGPNGAGKPDTGLRHSFTTARTQLHSAFFRIRSVMFAHWITFVL
jgi:ABC-type uncharacterized transport system ATPase subunit